MPYKTKIQQRVENLVTNGIGYCYAFDSKTEEEDYSKDINGLRNQFSEIGAEEVSEQMVNSILLNQHLGRLELKTTNKKGKEEYNLFYDVESQTIQVVEVFMQALAVYRTHRLEFERTGEIQREIFQNAS